MSKEQILLQTCHKKQFWSLTYLFITMYHVNREKLGIIGHPWSFWNSGCRKWRKAEIRHFHNQVPLIDSFTIFTSKYLFLGVGNIKNWWKFLLCNDSFSKSKMAPNYGQWNMSILYLCKRTVPLVVATKHVCVTLIPFWNNYYWFKHAKTNISRVFCIYWWQIGLLKVQNMGYMASLKPSSKCGPCKSS